VRKPRIFLGKPVRPPGLAFGNLTTLSDRRVAQYPSQAGQDQTSPQAAK
jgi:hypothetical protein